MIFTATPLSGAYIVEQERIADERGHFARTFSIAEFAELGLDARVAQCSVSFNRTAGTLRGMHYQADPHREAKLVRCTAGAVFDVIVDIRPGSPTQWQWTSAELSAANGCALFIPVGFAHGFQTLVDDTELSYQISVSYHAESGRGLRHDDPRLGLRWPLPHAIVNDRDRTWPLLPAGK